MLFLGVTRGGDSLPLGFISGIIPNRQVIPVGLVPRSPRWVCSPCSPDGFVLPVGTERTEGGHQGGACRHGCDPSNRAKLS